MENVPQSEPYLIKQLSKLFHRIERILVPSDFIKESDVGPKLTKLLSHVKRGDFFEVSEPAPKVSKCFGQNGKKNNKNSSEFNALRVKWEPLQSILHGIIQAELNTEIIPDKLATEIETERKAQDEVDAKYKIKMRVQDLQTRNGQPVLPGAWRKKPYPFRQYIPLTGYVATDSIPQIEADGLLKTLDTSLNGFLGPAYNYDDHTLTEEWMVSFKDRDSTSSLSTTATDDDVIRVQISSLLEVLTGQVQDRVCNMTGVLSVPPVGLGASLKEAPVWGMDSYTRVMIELAIADRASPEHASKAAVIFFIEKKLLPAINAQSPPIAHDITNALHYILQDQTSTVADCELSRAVLKEIAVVGTDLFRVHPKGTGVICVDPTGIPPHVCISDYLGEVYPPYRWCERIDVVEKARTTFGLKPALPDFYNILLERPRHDPGGYGLLYVDASQKANMGSSCSHSCNSNCTSAVVARDGKLVIVLTTIRSVQCGEELTMDYNSITTSDVEWRAAVCLCGMTSCRGSFLNFCTMDDLQQVLNQNCGPLWRYASLLRACSSKPLSIEDQAALARHGMLSVALGPDAPVWIKRYIADNLRFVEFERKALPCALLRARNGEASLYSFASADADARVVMEQRLQSMVCSVSMVRRVLEKQQQQLLHPLRIVSAVDAAKIIFSNLQDLPELIERYLILPLAYDVVGIMTNPHSASNSNKPKVTSENKSQTDGEQGVGQAVNKHVSALSEEWKKRLEKALKLFKKLDAESISSDDDAAVRDTKHTNLRRLLKFLFSVRELLQSATSSSTRTNADVTDCIASKCAGITEALSGISSTVPQQVTEVVQAKGPGKGLGWVRGVLTSLRELVVGVEDLTAPCARLTLLADLLVLYSNTTNFSAPQKFDRMESDPITVPARELGTSVPRCKIMKPEVVSKRKKPIGSMFNRVQSVEETREVSVNDFDTAVTFLPEINANDYNILNDEMTTTTSESAGSSSSIDHRPSTASMDSEILSVAEEAEGLTHGIVNLLEVSSTSRGTSNTSGKSEEDLSAAKVTAAVSSSASTTNSNVKQNNILDPNEPVFTGSKLYDEEFVFRQLVDWYKAGSEEMEVPPDLFGAVQLPLPSMCFGEAVSQYGESNRECLISILRSDKAQLRAWPAMLKDCFSQSEAVLKQWKSTDALMGSPMLDVALGQVDAVHRVLKDLGTSTKQYRTQGDENQLDDVLPPEVPTAWVQCESCHKWRRVAWHVDSDTLPEFWECHMNFWDPENSSCEASQDYFDPDAENTLKTTATEAKIVSECAKVGDWRDVFCLKNKVYYEAQVLKIKEAQPSPTPSKGSVNMTKNTSSKSDGPSSKKLLFHFKGWSSKFDEWINVDSDRISAHNLYTNPMSSKPKDQERWQGVVQEGSNSKKSAKKRISEEPRAPTKSLSQQSKKRKSIV